ncbi:MAG: Sec-independent protein translocase protein TatB [Gammaproteobacteria bacterium]
MFDLGFSELMVIGVVALVVVGPERLPKVARQAGQWLGKLQRYVSDVKSDINRQMELEELRSLQKEVTEAARDMESSLKATVNETQAELNSISDALTSNPSDSPSGSLPNSPAVEQTDWDRIYAARRTRDRIRERRIEREKSLGIKRPRRRT